ncbi:MAG: hypothetical protein ACLUFM_03025 [Lachnospiraceae bacterium]
MRPRARLPSTSTNTLYTDVYNDSYIDKYADQTLYKNYYDFMLDNRICAPLLPYDITDDHADKYLSNPRVTAFAISGSAGMYGDQFSREDEEIVAYWNKLQSKVEWSDKGFFYYGEEIVDVLQWSFTTATRTRTSPILSEQLPPDCNTEQSDLLRCLRTDRHS